MKNFPNYRKKSPMYESCVPNRENMLQEASEALQRLFPFGSLGRRVRDAQKALCAKPFEWTRNRVSDMFNAKEHVVVHAHEAAHLDHLERQRAIAEAKEKHAAYKDETTRRRALAESIIAALELQDAEFHGGQIEALRSVMGRVADAGTDGGRE